MRLSVYGLFLGYFLMGWVHPVGAVDLVSDNRGGGVFSEKPPTLSALSWVQRLETQRDQAEKGGDQKTFKNLTDEISATLAGKYGLASRRATPEEEALILHSMTRTRCGLRHEDQLIYTRYLGYDRAKTNSLLQKDKQFQAHIAALLALDTAIAKALDGTPFQEGRVPQRQRPTPFSPAFIPSLLSHAQRHENKELVALLKPSLEHFLKTQQSLVLRVYEKAHEMIDKKPLVKKGNHPDSSRDQVMQGELGDVVFSLLPVQDALSYAQATAVTYNSFAVWDVIRQVHFSHIPTSFIQGYEEGTAEGLRTALLVFRYMQSHFQTLLAHRETLITNTLLMKRLSLSYTPSFLEALRVYALLAAHKPVEGLEEKADTLSPEAQQTLNTYMLRLFYHLRIDPLKARTYLEKRARQGNTHAQIMLNEAAEEEVYGFFKGTEGRAYLEQRAHLGDQDAQDRLTEATRSGNLGCIKDQQARAYLEHRAHLGDKKARHILYEDALKKIEILKHDAFKNRTSVLNDRTGRDYLESWANQGDQEAQELLNQEAQKALSVSADHPWFDRTEARTYLAQRAKLGDQDAYQRICGTKGECTSALIFDTPKVEKMKQLANEGDEAAQRTLNKMAVDGLYGARLTSPCACGCPFSCSRLYLHQRASLGDEHAQYLLNQNAAGEGGILKIFTGETGRLYLDQRIALGDRHAQKLLIHAAVKAKSGFTRQTGKVYLEKRAALGDTYAQKALFWGIKRDQESFNSDTVITIPWFFHFYNSLSGWSDRGDFLERP